MVGSLTVALRLRELAVAAAQRNLSEAIGLECAARADEFASTAAIAREVAAASVLAATDDLVEAFRVWLPGGREAQRTAGRKLAEASAATVHARAKLAAVRTGEAAIMAVIQQRRQNAEAQLRRHDQRVIDEIASGDKT